MTTLPNESRAGASHAAGREAVPRRGVSLRAVLIAFALVPLNVLFLVSSVFRDGSTAEGPIYFNVVGLLLGLVLLNQALRSWRPRWAFGAGEVLTIYAILGMSTGLVGGVWWVGGLLPASITYPFWFATDANQWQQLLWPNLPVWLTVRDPRALQAYWSGDTAPYQWDAVRAWVRPALWWASFMAAAMWVCLCLNSIVRRRWADEEKLPFPLTTIPVYLVEERFGLLRSKGFWIALAAAFGVSLWNTIATIAPSLPTVPLNFHFAPYLIGHPPWDRITHLCQYLDWRPSQITLCYLAPLDLLFSLFVFDLFWLADYVLPGYLGWGGAVVSYPFFEQMAGALVGLALGYLWFDRRYFLQVLRKALGLRSAIQHDREEAFSYRAAVLGALLGLAYCWWFWVRAGVPSWVLALFLGLYFAVEMVLVRIRAQVGGPHHELYMGMPDTMLRGALGSLRMGPRALGMLMLLQPLLVGDQENSPVPLQLETLKMAEGGRMERRRIALALAAVAPLTILLSFWAYIQIGYPIGAGTAQASRDQIWVARETTEQMAAALRNPGGTNTSASLAMGFGGVFSIILLFVKLRFHWWPLHPIAFPMANAWLIHALTFTILAIWLFKVLLLRYGGLRAHRAALPFFLGLLVGEFSAWTLSRAAILLFHLDVPW